MEKQLYNDTVVRSHRGAFTRAVIDSGETVDNLSERLPDLAAGLPELEGAEAMLSCCNVSLTCCQKSCRCTSTASAGNMTLWSRR
jgi:hypothetical protein